MFYKTKFLCMDTVAQNCHCLQVLVYNTVFKTKCLYEIKIITLVIIDLINCIM